jgi:RHH-type proline utilization regulon transcriptional repressor/proline dehydrogenase/delta 1-pyrroline-5-carboxylate dehydrogenase
VTGPPDGLGDALAAPAAVLARDWARRAATAAPRAERRRDARLRAVTADDAAVAFTTAFADRVLRPEDPAVAAAQLRRLAAGGVPPFLGPVDRALLRTGAVASRAAPAAVMRLARRRLRQLVGPLVVDRADRVLAPHLRALRDAGFAVNVNLLGEAVLGEGEAARRRRATLDLIARDDVDHVSVKASALTSQLVLWAHDVTVRRVVEGLRPVVEAAAATSPPTFVHLDMEQYADLEITLDAFTRLLDEPTLRAVEAGIALQAYLPDAFDALRRLVAWATARRAAGGAAVRVRLVKGANLAMEHVDAGLHGWVPAPYATKAETDASYARLLDWLLVPERVGAVRVGVASHNPFDLAWAHLLAGRRGVHDRVTFELLHGMAPGLARTVRDATGRVLLYVPVVAAADFDTALAYLVRRLDEQRSGEGVLRRLPVLGSDDAAFAAERDRFTAAVARRWEVATAPRRRTRRPAPVDGFANEPDGDPTDPATRAAVVAALADVASGPGTGGRPELDAAGVDAVVARARAAAPRWAATPAETRRRTLRRVGDELAGRRPALVALMADEAGKAVGEGDVEVSEAVDHARYAAERIADLGRGDGVVFEPLGVVVVVPPWNFPVAIPTSGVVAALAAGNAVVLKPAPETPRCAEAVAEACWAAGVPRDVLQVGRCVDGPVAERLVGHDGVDGIVLTGAYATAERLAAVAPRTPLFAETSGKNAIVVMPDADLDLAVADLVRSAFGHAGQKCSAASLAICVGNVATSARFRRQLVDAARTLAVGDARHPGTVVGPLIGPPSDDLRRALTAPAAGERWLLEPRLLDPATHLWSPGILDGVAPGSWFARTECFGPVLGLVAAADLDAALAVQDASPYGLTGGLHTLDPATVERWLDRVPVGNAYVNRATTGAVVRRQPFGGWKRSVVGPGAKAGGPGYVAQLGRWRPVADPERGADPSPRVAALADALAAGLDAAGRRSLRAAVRSDARWWAADLGVEHDPSGLAFEENRFRYRPLPEVVVRVAADARPVDVVRVLAATELVGAPRRVSVAPGYPGSLDAVAHRRELAPAFAATVAATAPARVRVVGTEAVPGAAPATYVDDRSVVGDGRVELARYLREQAVSRTVHRFGVVERGRR